jgi:hypothetical protein
MQFKLCLPGFLTLQRFLLLKTFVYTVNGFGLKNVLPKVNLNKNGNNINAPLLSTSHDCGGIQGSSRRQFIQTSTLGGIVTAAVAGVPSIAVAAGSSATLKASSTALGSGLLESRVLENLMSPPTYGLEIPDIYYPS